MFTNWFCLTYLWAIVQELNHNRLHKSVIWLLVSFVIILASICITWFVMSFLGVDWTFYIIGRNSWSWLIWEDYLLVHLSSFSLRFTQWAGCFGLFHFWCCELIIFFLSMEWSFKSILRYCLVPKFLASVADFVLQLEFYIQLWILWRHNCALSWKPLMHCLIFLDRYRSF